MHTTVYGCSQVVLSIQAMKSFFLKGQVDRKIANMSVKTSDCSNDLTEKQLIN